VNGTFEALSDAPGPFERHKAQLVALFQKVQALSREPDANRLLGLEIQEELILRISAAERSIQRSRKVVAGIKKALSSQHNTKAQSRVLKARMARVQDGIQGKRDLIDLLRDIGDCIAFIYVDRFDLKPLVFREAPGFITGKVGARLERAILRAVYRHDAVGILNDLTHTVRHGDVMVLAKDRPFMLIEAKSGRGGKRSRTDRQMAAANTMMDYLTTDAREEDGEVWRRVATAQPFVSHGLVAAEMIRALPDAGWLAREVERGLHYLLIDCRADYDFAEVFGGLVADGRPFLLSVNGMKAHQLGYYPFPLSFDDPEVTFRFYNGEFVMFVVADLTHMTNALRDAGCFLEVTEDDRMPFKVGPLGAETATEGISFVGFHVLGRLAAEFASLDWVLTNVMTGEMPEALVAELTRQAEAN